MMFCLVAEKSIKWDVTETNNNIQQYTIQLITTNINTRLTNIEAVFYITKFLLHLILQSFFSN